MAIFPGTIGDDILSSRRISEVVGELQARTSQKMSCLPGEEGLDLLKGLKARLEEEIAFEQHFSASFSKALEELALAKPEVEFPAILSNLNDLAQQYFLKRQSVVAVHSLCNAYRDTIVSKTLEHVEHMLEAEGLGGPPVPYCFLGVGSIGRSEQTFCVDPSYVLIHGDIPAAADYFETFVNGVLTLLERVGFFQNGGKAAAVKALWRGNRTDWRREITEELVTEDKGRLLELTRRADLRLICGDPALADEMINTVWSMLEFFRGDLRDTSSEAIAARTRAAFSFPVPGLRDMGKGIAEMPIGLDFFSRLRVEKRGRHQGEFDLGRFALAPLINNVRILAIKRSLHETSTIERIKGLQEHGHLSVELTARLLRAYHDFTTFKIRRQISGGCDKENACFIDPRDLDEDDQLRLRNGLEAVSGLEKIAYLSFTEQG